MLWSSSCKNTQSVKPHHAVLQDEAPWYCATRASGGRRIFQVSQVMVAANYQVFSQHWEFACSKFRDQPTAEWSSRSVAELKQKMLRSSDDCSLGNSGA